MNASILKPLKMAVALALLVPGFAQAMDLGEAKQQLHPMVQNMAQRDRNQAQETLVELANHGVPVDQALAIVRAAIAQGFKGQELASLAQQVRRVPAVPSGSGQGMGSRADRAGTGTGTSDTARTGSGTGTGSDLARSGTGTGTSNTGLTGTGTGTGSQAARAGAGMGSGEAVGTVVLKAIEHKHAAKEVDMAVEAAGQAIEKGVSPGRAAEVVTLAIDKGVRGKELAVVAAEYTRSVQKGLSHDEAMQRASTRAEQAQRRGPDRGTPGGLDGHRGMGGGFGAGAGGIPGGAGAGMGSGTGGR